MNKRLFLLWLLSPAVCCLQAADFTLFKDGQAAPIILVTGSEDPVSVAADMLQQDVGLVTDHLPVLENNTMGFRLKKSCILAGTLGVNKSFDRFLAKMKVETTILKQHPEAFRLQVITSGEQPVLLILGSDAHGTAFGLMELSRFIGVSPWVWWADSPPDKQTNLVFPSGKVIQDYPSVRYRGIFLNDEDWGLMPWASKTLNPEGQTGVVGPDAYERIFQLLLRLRGNLIWPAMHGCTKPFFFVPGNAGIAKKYGIYVGTSHCEPCLCNINGEWDRTRLGAYDYTVNADTILNYWRNRVRLTREAPAIYTIGIRGEHDGKMQGANTVEEQRVLLQRVLADQRQMLQETLGKKPENIPQVVVPYKEVLDVYDAGLKVPEDVTLVWCDDNYGYISRLSNAREATRSGGAGVYYHVSYWGRPHDYLWLATSNPALMLYEMTRAWDHAARNLWVLNVGDIKPSEYLTEYFLDLAWSTGKSSMVSNNAVTGNAETSRYNKLPYSNHLNAFFTREFGVEKADLLTSVMQQFYQLATYRKPEHMAWTRVEEAGFQGGKSPVIDTEFNEEEINQRLKDYAILENQVRTIEEQLPGAKRDAYFQLVSYPVYGTSLLNQKILYAQLARRYFSEDSVKAASFAAASLFASHEIKRLTRYYNETMSNGKWNRMMYDHPRDLPVFGEPVLPEALKSLTPKPLMTPRVILRSALMEKESGMAGSSMLSESDSCIAFNASVNCPDRPLSGLGHSGSAVCLKKGELVRYQFSTTSTGKGTLTIYTLPNHAADGGDLRFDVRLNEEAPVTINTRTFGRSETWKEGVLRNQLKSSIAVAFLKPGLQTLIINALDDDIILDQLMLDFKTERKGYLVPK